MSQSAYQKALSAANRSIAWIERSLPADKRSQRLLPQEERVANPYLFDIPVKFYNAAVQRVNELSGIVKKEGLSGRKIESYNRTMARFGRAQALVIDYTRDVIYSKDSDGVSEAYQAFQRYQDLMRPPEWNRHPRKPDNFFDVMQKNIGQAESMGDLKPFLENDIARVKREADKLRKELETRS